ncbi:VTC domain-containing protein [Chloroflexota bacterium]
MILNALKQASLRYERKFLISELSRFEVEAIVKLHPAIFSEIYQQRFVNNIYFDTINASSFADNVSGVSERLKVRVRWYGDVFGLIEKPILEFKTKKGLTGGKVRFPINSFYLDSNYSLGVQQDSFIKSGIPDILLEYLKPLRFTLLNHYSRKYFESANRKFRITIDFDMESFKIDSRNNSFIEEIIDRKHTILELKYSDEHDEEARLITNYFPFRMTKSSKYVTGFDQFHSFMF